VHIRLARVIAHASALRTRRALGTALAGLVLALVALLWTAAPASAHDELVGSDPADGATVDVLPAQITLSFSAELLSDGSSTVVEVTDAAGTSLTDGAPAVSGAMVTQPLTGDGSGAIAVVWRVVSSDGHPIAGEFSFTAAGAAPAPTPTETATPSPAASPTASASSPAASTSATPTPAPAESGAVDPLPWIIGAVVLVIVIGLVVWWLGARARQQKQVSEDRTAGRSDSGGR
jgi:methionine-rich copper-binding protein CopC